MRKTPLSPPRDKRAIARVLDVCRYLGEGTHGVEVRACALAAEGGHFHLPVRELFPRAILPTLEGITSESCIYFPAANGIVHHAKAVDNMDCMHICLEFDVANFPIPLGHPVLNVHARASTCQPRI